MTEKKGQGFGFGLGKIKELQEAFKKAQEVQEGAKRLQDELENTNIEGQSQDGLVKVIMSGNQEPRGVTIQPDAMGKTCYELSALVTEAMQDAYAKSTEVMRSKMDALTTGLNLPGL